MATVSPAEQFCQQGMLALRQKQFAAAKQAFEQALALQANSHEAHEGLATVAFVTKDYDGAITHFTRLTLLDPRNAKWQVNLGAVFNKTARHQQAVDSLRKGIMKDRTCADAYYNLGLAYKALDQLINAISAYREAIRLEPKLSEAHLNLANCYVDQANIPLAIVHYKKALEIDPEFDRAKRGLQNAQAGQLKSREQRSPFGRLVDEKAIRDKEVQGTVRQLTAQERVEDRLAVHALAQDLIKAADDALLQMRTQLERGIVHLDRAISEAAKSPFALADEFEKFQSTLQLFHAHRQTVRRKILELRAHEELINTPELNP